MATVFLFFLSSIFLDGPAEVFSYVLFIVVLGACHMPRTSEIMETADLKKYEKSCSSITKKPYVSTITISIATKLSRVLTYHGEVQLMKSEDPLIKWSREITWEANTIISPAPQRQPPSNLAGW